MPGRRTIEHEQAETERIRADSYLAARRFINRLYPNRGRLLEVGSGGGFLLAAFRADGWRVHGIDPDAEACHHARERHGVAVYGVALADAGIPDRAFDVVVLGRRTVSDPLGALAELNRILRSGGHCLIDLPPSRPGAPPPTSSLRAMGFRPIQSATVAVPPAAGVSRRLGLYWLGLSGAAPRWERVWLQKVRVLGGSGAAGPPSSPAWLCREVAGVVTVERGACGPNVRRGYPWRVPDPASPDEVAVLPPVC